MKLWSIQNENQFQNYKKTGHITGDPEKAMFPKAYKWLVSEMNNKLKSNITETYPVWAWYKYGKKKRPDLRESGYAKRGTTLYLFELEIPDNEVILTDFDYWHYVLNNVALIPDLDEFYTNEEKLESWKNIFDLNFRLYDDCDDEKFPRYVQATFWEIKKENVVSIKKFVAK